MLDAAPKTSKAQLLGRILLGLMLVSSGVSHLTYLREPFQAQVPPWVPLSPDLVVVLSGCVEHRSIHRAPRGIWVGHGHGSTCPTFLSACSGRLGALEYRGVDSPSTILGQTRMITVRCVKVFLGSSEQS